MDDGKNMAARIGGIMKAPKKALVWQFLDGYTLIPSILKEFEEEHATFQMQFLEKIEAWQCKSDFLT